MMAKLARTVLTGLAGVVMVSTVSLGTQRTAVSPSTETPEAFVRRVYAQYRTFDSPGVPTDRPGGTRFYTAVLLDAFAKESASVHGEVGVIDADPLCACQAYENLRVKGVAVTAGETGAVRAKVTFVNLGARHTVTLTLVRTSAGWRIGDVGNRNMTSVMVVLQAAIAHPTQEMLSSNTRQSPKH